MMPTCESYKLIIAFRQIDEHVCMISSREHKCFHHLLFTCIMEYMILFQLCSLARSHIKTKGVARTSATSKMESFVTSVNGF